MMTQERLDVLIAAAQQRRAKLAAEKGKEYTQGNPDRLANFRRAGSDLKPFLREGMTEPQTAGVVWLTLFNKHYDAVKSFIVHGREFSTESIEGRIDDMQVYLDLMRGIVEEIRESQPGLPLGGKDAAHS